MSRLILRGGLVLLMSATAGYLVWKSEPGSDLDRQAFIAVASGFENPPLFVTGHGTHAEPWALRSFSSQPRTDHAQAPVIVSLGDDPEGVFQSSPPAPIDLAVIFTNFHRLGARKAATAAVLAWEDVDPIALTALDKSLARFDSLVMAAPLSRGAVASPMPAAFRRGSIALTETTGNTSELPVVNRVPISSVILGGDNAMAGFSVLEMEPPTEAVPMLARWDDRVVFSFPLLVVMQRLNVAPDTVKIDVGNFIKLGSNGPLLPIDASGRFTMPPKPVGAYAEISAAELIDGGDDLFPKQVPDPVILRDDLSAAEPATRGFSRTLAATVAALASDSTLAGERRFPRWEAEREFGVLGLLAMALTATSALRRAPRHAVAAALIGSAFAAQWIGVGMASVWLPGMTMVTMICTAVVVSDIIPQPAEKRTVEGVTTSDVAVLPVIDLDSPPAEPASPVFELTPNPPEKKSTSRKSSSKKSSASRKPRSKKNPPSAN